MNSSKGTKKVPTFRLPDPEDIPIVPTGAKPSLFQRTFYPILFLAVMAFILSTLVSFSSQSTQTVSKAAGVDAALTLAGAPTSATPGSEFTLGLFLNLPSGTTNKVSALDAYVTYSSNLEVVSVTPNAFFMEFYDTAKTVMLNSIQTNTAGVVRMVFGVPCTTTASGGPNNNQWWCYTRSTTGQVATLRFRVKPGSTGTATVGFDKTKTVAASTTNGDANIINQTSLSTVTIPLGSTITPTQSPNSVPVSLKLKFRGVNSAASQKARVIVKQGATEIYRNTSLTISSDPQGIFTGQLQVPPGSYDVFVKGQTHLQKKYALTVPSAGGTIDLTAVPMLGGDVTGNADGTQDGIVDIVDIGRVITYYDQASPTTKPCDVNLDGLCELLDIGFMITNYDRTDEK